MPFEPRKAGFVLVSTGHGPMLVNRFDRQISPVNGEAFGVGHYLLEEGAMSMGDIDVIKRMLDERRKHFGERVMMLDCGANIGTHTVSLANHMTSWGNVAAFECQERLYGALWGNITLNNCFNAQAFHVAVGAVEGTLMVPHLNFLEYASYGSLEMVQSNHNEAIGQAVDYTNAARVKMVSIDSLHLHRLDFIKLDVEGMELAVLHGAEGALETFFPVLYIEYIKTDPRELTDFLESHGYSWTPSHINFLCVHKSDPCHDLLVKAAKTS